MKGKISKQTQENSCWITWYQIAFTIFLLILNTTKFSLVQNQSENGKGNIILFYVDVEFYVDKNQQKIPRNERK